MSTGKPPDRWLQPFGESLLADSDLAMAMQIPLLANLSADAFPSSESLSGILRHDTRIRKFKPGDVVMLAGEYGHSIFFILQGSATVILGHPLPLNRLRQSKRSWWQTLSFLWKNPKSREVRSEDQLHRAHFKTRTRTSGSVQVVISDNDRWLADKHTGTMYAGDMFGETAALIRSPRIASVIADQYLLVLEMGRQGFLDILRYDSRFKQYIDGLYRARSLRSHLVRSPLFSHLSADVIDEITEHTLIKTYGRFEWRSSFERQNQRGASESDPIIVEQGASLEGLIIIQTGFARLSVQQDSNQRTIDYASDQELFGWEEIVAHWRDGAELVSRYRLTALGYTDILLVPTHLLIKYILPSVAAHLLPELSSPGENAATTATTGTIRHPGESHSMSQSFLDFVVDKHVINGTTTMFINANRCVGCDDCVRACAASHGNNPRFVREGSRSGRWVVINACMHCVDPVCLTGCPTGAIQRTTGKGLIVINEGACVGCATCVNECPYDSIRMVDIYTPAGNPVRDENGVAVRKASKCDLCFDLPGGAACVRACSYDALTRIDMRDRQALISMSKGQ